MESDQGEGSLVTERKVRNIKSGAEGTIVGSVEIDGKPYVKIKFSDYESTIPVESFARIYQDSEHYTPPEVIDENSKLRTIIKTMRDESPFAQADFLLKNYEVAKDVLKLAEEKDYIFRSELRPPIQAIRDDTESKGGIFVTGFEPSDNYHNLVSTTPVFGFADRYPSDEDLPEGWDGIKYMYIIDPFNPNLKPKEMDYLEISYQSIPSSAIKYSLRLKANAGEKEIVEEIYTNSSEDPEQQI